jgi:hypothetical protein|tara:strand:- start:27 stop:1904 length:1878 start_codon:yes stop_codon:yes gene_type:complete
MASTSLKNLQQSEKKKSYLGTPPSTRIPGLIEMIVEGDDFILSKGGTKFKADFIDVGGKKYTKAALIKMTKTATGNWKKTSPERTALIRSINILPTVTIEKKTKRKGNDQVWIVGKKAGKEIKANPAQVEKTGKLGGKAGGDPATSTPGTEMQETVTLRIFEILLGPSNYKPKGKTDAILERDFDLLCTGKMPGFGGFNLSDTWPGLKPIPKAKGGDGVTPAAKIAKDIGMREWYYHFLLQFKKVEFETKLPDGAFDVFDYDQFLNFITNLVKFGPPKEALISKMTSEQKVIKSNRLGEWEKFGKITQKDSWNPADIWLVNKSAPNYDGVMLDIKRAQYITEVNQALIAAFKSNPPVIVGISLKKTVAGSSPKTHESKKMHYELLNLTMKGGNFEQLNPIKYNKWQVNLPWDNKKLEFEILTNEFTLDELPRKGTGKKASMRIGSSQSGTHNINLEYKPIGGGAQLGKIPKNLLEKYIQDEADPGYTLPNWKDALKEIPDVAAESDSKYTAMTAKIDIVLASPILEFKNKSQFKKGSKYPFIEAIIDGKKNGKWKKDSPTHKSITMGIQILNWAYDLTMVYKNLKKPSGVTNLGQFEVFIKDTYNMAQKRGEIFGTRFGPFGKIS